MEKSQFPLHLNEKDLNVYLKMGELKSRHWSPLEQYKHAKSLLISVSLLNSQPQDCETSIQLSIGILSAHAAEFLMKSLIIMEGFDLDDITEQDFKEKMLYEKHNLDDRRPGHQLLKLFQYLSHNAMWDIYLQFTDFWPTGAKEFLIFLALENKHFEYRRYAYEFEDSNEKNSMFVKELAESILAYYDDKYLLILKKYLLGLY